MDRKPKFKVGDMADPIYSIRPPGTVTRVSPNGSGVLYLLEWPGGRWSWEWEEHLAPTETSAPDAVYGP